MTGVAESGSGEDFVSQRRRPHIVSVALIVSVTLIASPWRVFAGGAAAGGPVLYVDAGATGPAHDGGSWCSAFLELHEALSVAASGTVVRVADGTYRPSSSGVADPRDATFALVSEVVIEGGYAGCGAADPDLRDLSQFETILSGDLMDNDAPVDEFRDCCRPTSTTGCINSECQTLVCGEEPLCCSLAWGDPCVALADTHCTSLCISRDDNAIHVVTGTGVDSSSVLDGFAIEAGQADQGGFGSPKEFGAGVFVDGGSPTVAHCVLRYNEARRRSLPQRQ